MTQELPILTPEKALVTVRLANLGSRITAHIVDLAILGGALAAISIGTFSVLAAIALNVAVGIIITLVSLGPFAYFILFEGFWNGLTPGKRLQGLRVTMADGTPVTPFAAMSRNFLRMADILPGPYLVGLAAIFLNAKSQRIGDLVANTVVVHERHAVVRHAAPPHRMGLHPLESEVGELRGMTTQEYMALRRFMDRYPELSARTQAQLMAELWEPLAKRLQIPPLPNVDPRLLAEAVVMRYGREHGLL